MAYLIALVRFGMLGKPSGDVNGTCRVVRPEFIQTGQSDAPVCRTSPPRGPVEDDVGRIARYNLVWIALAMAVELRVEEITNLLDVLRFFRPRRRAQRNTGNDDGGRTSKMDHGRTLRV
jgi:hypothetical protein